MSDCNAVNRCCIISSEHEKKMDILFEGRTEESFSETTKQKLIDLNKELKKKKKDGRSLWDLILQCYSYPASFMLHELQDVLLEELKSRNSEIKERELKEELNSILSEKKFVMNTTQRKQYLDDKCEANCQAKINEIATGEPGLLLRGLKCDKRKYYNLKKVIGDLSPACETLGRCLCPENYGHCMNSNAWKLEMDNVFLYPGKDGKLHIRIIEVKRPQSEKANQNYHYLVEEALFQTRKDTRFLLGVLKDVSLLKLDIKTFAAVPEKEKDNNFCGNCSKYVLFKEDFDDNNHLRKKICLQQRLANREDELFLTACARLRCLVGEFTTKVHNQSRQWMVEYEENMKKIVMIYDIEQRDVLNNFDKHPEWKNFVFSGPAGSGKTMLSLEVTRKLIRRYQNLDATQIYIYATSAQKQYSEEPQLLSYFNIQLQQISKEFSDENQIEIFHKCKPLFVLMKEITGKSECDVDTEIETMTLPLLCENLDRSIVIRNKSKNSVLASPKRQWCNSLTLQYSINEMMIKLKEIHKDAPVILLIDEVLNDRSPSVGTLTPPGCRITTASPQDDLNLIICYNPENRGDFRIGDEDTSFFTKHFVVRYRNSEKIMNLTKSLSLHCNTNHVEDERLGPIIGTRPRDYVKEFMEAVCDLMSEQRRRTAQELAPKIQGETPRWVDLGVYSNENFKKMSESTQFSLSDKDDELQKLKVSISDAVSSLLSKGSREDAVLLYDGHLPEEILSHIKTLEYPRRKYEERAIHGREFDHVITISSGYLETLTRAKITLGIITLRMENSEEKRFPKLLQMHVEQGLLIKENVEEAVYEA